MATSPLAMRIIASSILIANRAGIIIRDVMSNGELGIVDKVRLSNLIECLMSTSKTKNVNLLSFLGQR